MLDRAAGGVKESSLLFTSIVTPRSLRERLIA